MALAGFDVVHDFGDAAGEAKACRTDCALFDFSFLECARLEGSRARDAIKKFICRSPSAFVERAIVYALRTDRAGVLVADLTVWRTGAETFEVMSGRREDVVALLDCAGPDVDVADVTSQRAVFAVQGPGTLAALRKVGDVRRIELLKYFTFDRADLAGIPCTVGRLGYTGEPGVEIIVDRRQANDLWQALAFHVTPAGFIAADMLRIEAGFVLFSNEFRLPVSAHEAGLEKFGRSVEQRLPALSLISFRADADGLSWPWQPSGDLKRPAVPGEIAVTSACQSVAAGGILGLGYVLAGTAAETTLHDPRGTFRNIRPTAKPFYDTAKRRPHTHWR